MSLELFGSIAYLIPGWFLTYELMEAVPHLGITIEAVCSNWK